jgi:MtN3 and saliva related transmembrane protein
VLENEAEQCWGTDESEERSMDLVTGIGFMAGTLTTIAFLPQLQRTWMTRSAEDVSLAMLLTFTTGVLLWFVYGVFLGSWPIILTNLVTFLLTTAILILKLFYRK